jgi:hypothetical protein
MANPTGTGLKPAKKGERLVGRKPGVPNRFTSDLKEAILGAAEDIGEIEEIEILDKDGNSTGKFRRRRFIEALVEAGR